ncbi:MAG: response regulator transcription factor [Acetobacteraceae bacterium]|nr:response regulator transcription factor [Acetobacteraceae bacterium]
MPSLLVVEDDPRVADFLGRGLRAEGYAVVPARNGVEALELAGSARFDAILLDVMLPGSMDGREICRQLRARRDPTPILMLTALDAVEDRVEGLRVGADDYLGKPFAFDELLARIDALIRRGRRFAEAPRIVTLGDLAFDREALTVARAGRRLELTAKELALLDLLLSAPGRLFSRERILNSVWGLSEDPLTNVVDVYIGRLRRKLETGEDGAAMPVIRTVRGLGYRLEPPGVAVDDPDGAERG